MHERLSFYVHRSSILHRLNPLTKIVITSAILTVCFASPWYWTAAVVIPVVIIPLSFLGRVQREYVITVSRLALPAVGFIFVMQSLFLAREGDVIFEFWFIEVTDANLRAAFLISTRIFAMISAFIIFLLTTHPSELISDLTRRKLPATFSYVIISTLQIIPQMQAKAQTIIAAQRSRGLDTEGSFIKRVKALVPLVGPLVFGSLVEVEERAIAIEARAFSSSLPKTSLYEVPDTGVDKTIRWILLALILITLVSRIWLWLS